MRNTLCSVLLLVLHASGAAQEAPPGDHRVIVSAPWGEAVGAFRVEDHGARLGPSALVAAGERLYVLDRVAGRVQVFGLDGALLDVLQVGSTSVDMLAVDGEGAVLVLDAFVRREVRVLRGGRRPEVVPLPDRGRLLPSGVFAGDGSFQVEWQHGATTVVPCPGLRAPWPDGPRTDRSLPGRPTPRGWVRATRSAAGVTLELGTGASPRARRFVVPGSSDAQEIVALRADARGRVLVAWVERRDTARRLQVALVGDDGGLITHLRIPDGSTTDLYQRLALAGDGRLFQLRTGHGGVEIVEWHWPADVRREGEER